LQVGGAARLTAAHLEIYKQMKTILRIIAVFDGIDYVQNSMPYGVLTVRFGEFSPTLCAL